MSLLWWRVQFAFGGEQWNGRSVDGVDEHLQLLLQFDAFVSESKVAHDPQQVAYLFDELGGWDRVLHCRDQVLLFVRSAFLRSQPLSRTSLRFLRATTRVASCITAA